VGRWSTHHRLGALLPPWICPHGPMAPIAPWTPALRVGWQPP
jgi:hypothetical protein